MKVQYTDTEVVISLSKTMQVRIDNILNYLEYELISSKHPVAETDAQHLANLAKEGRFKRLKSS